MSIPTVYCGHKLTPAPFQAQDGGHAIRTTMNVSLTPGQKFVRNHEVATGRYQTASQVVREALRLLEEQERQRRSRFSKRQSKLKQRITNSKAERGELLAGDKVFAEIRQHSARRRKDKA